MDMDQPKKNSCGGFSTTFADTHKRCTALSMNPNKKQITNLQQRSKEWKIKDQYSTLVMLACIMVANLGFLCLFKKLQLTRMINITVSKYLHCCVWREGGNNNHIKAPCCIPKSLQRPALSCAAKCNTVASLSWAWLLCVCGSFPDLSSFLHVRTYECWNRLDLEGACLGCPHHVPRIWCVANPPAQLPS